MSSTTVRRVFRRKILLPVVLVTSGVIIGATIFTVTSASGSSTATTTVPSWVGLPVTNADVASTTEANPTLFVVNRQPSTIAPAGVIVAESPAPGSPIAPGAVVTLTVSAGFPAGYAPPTIP